MSKILYEFIEEVELNRDKIYYTTKNGIPVHNSISSEYSYGVLMFNYIVNKNKKTRKVLDSILIEEQQ